MVKLRFKRIGKKNQPYFRLVAADVRSPVQGKFIEELGWFNPRSKEFKFKKKRVDYWLEQGAQTSARVHNLLVDNKIVQGPKRQATHVKQKQSEEEAQEEVSQEKSKKEEEEKE